MGSTYVNLSPKDYTCAKICTRVISNFDLALLTADLPVSSIARRNFAGRHDGADTHALRGACVWAAYRNGRRDSSELDDDAKKE